MLINKSISLYLFNKKLIIFLKLYLFLNKILFNLFYKKWGVTSSFNYVEMLLPVYKLASSTIFSMENNVLVCVSPILITKNFSRGNSKFSSSKA